MRQARGRGERDNRALQYHLGSPVPCWKTVELYHRVIIGFLIQSCSPGANNFTNYVFCHPQFSGVIQNIENCCARKLIILIIIDIDKQESKWDNDFQYFG